MTNNWRPVIVSAFAAGTPGRPTIAGIAARRGPVHRREAEHRRQHPQPASAVSRQQRLQASSVLVTAAPPDVIDQVAAVHRVGDRPAEEAEDDRGTSATIEVTPTISE